VTNYLGEAAVQQLDQAQRLLDAHVLVLNTGACRLCGTMNSCGYRDAASSTFARYRALPRRRPGASQPQLVGTRRVAGYDAS
jgi:hypothetical protein